MNPFATFTVQPSYGLISAAIDWSLTDATPGGGGVYFYRSVTGHKDWVILNEGAPLLTRSGQFVDTTPAPDAFTPVYYRGLVDMGGDPPVFLKGPPVTALDAYTKREHQIARAVLRREFKAMAGPYGNGQPCLHYIPKDSGVAAALVDPETGQILGPACPQDPADGYGTLIAGGFAEPIKTWTRIITIAPEDRKDRGDGTGEDQEATIKLRLLAFPRPDEGHVIVFEKSDRRYVVKCPIESFRLRGTIPLFWEAEADLLDRDDPRYRLVPPSGS